MELADPNKKTKVYVRGYILPGRRQLRLTEFSICRTSDQCRFANKANRPTDLIHIELTGDRTMDYTTHQIGVGGIFQVDLESLPHGTPYSIKADYLSIREKCEKSPWKVAICVVGSDGILRLSCCLAHPVRAAKACPAKYSENLAMAKYVVRYGAMRVLGVCSAHSSAVYCRDARVIARTERGLEAAVVLGEATEAARAALKDPGEGQILRTMTAEDEHELLRIAEQARRELDVCQTYVDRLGLEMSLVELERIFGGERVVVYYLAENRVDFRELVRLLAAEFQTRIEMRQIGVRDEAKLLADYGDCGKPTCCNSHLVQMPPVSMRMAKMQKATLDPTKISGRCGRLKCCLRYEFEMYEQQELPLVQLDDWPVGPPGGSHRSRRLGTVRRS